MSDFKEASRLKLRFTTEKGFLSAEQLWDLSLPVLDRLAIQLEEEYKESGKKSFLIAKSKKDKVAKLKFDIVIDILTTKVDEAKAVNKAAETKAHNQKILALIAEKSEEDLKEKSIEELEAMLKK